MCGRYTLHSRVSDLKRLLGDVAVPDDLVPRYNIAPTQAAAVVPNEGERRVELFRWGLIPYWAKDPSIGSKLINARAETLAEKPSFRAAFKKRRCLVPADGFFEWRKEADGKTKTPLLLRMKSREPFAFAGLWESWKGPDGAALRSFTIITTEANALAATVHARMPVILPRERHDAWLAGGDAKADDLRPLLLPYPAVDMEAVEVSRLVNSPRNDSPACIEEVRHLWGQATIGTVPE